MTRRIFAVIPHGWWWYITDDFENAEGRSFLDTNYWYGPYSTRDEAWKKAHQLKLAN